MTQPPGPYQQFPGQQPGGYPQQPGGYPQQPGYPPQGGYGHAGPQGPYGGPPKKSPLPWILGGVGGLLVIGGAVTAIILLTGDDDNGGGSGSGDEAADTSTAEGAAQGVVAAINNEDAEGLVALTCEQLKPQMKMFSLVLADPKSIPGLPPELQGKMDAVDVSAEFQRIEQKSDTEAEAYFKLRMDGLPPEAAQFDMEPEQDMDFPFMLTNGKWELCDPEGHLFGSDAPSSGGGAATPSPASVPTP